MKKWIKRLLLILVVLCAALFFGYYLNLQQERDHTAPEIFMETDVISVSVYAQQDCLLDGVTAWDDRDGDVTEFLVVEGVSAIGEDHSATVTYAAFDQAGNVTKAERVVSYTDYEGPKFDFTVPLVFRSGYVIDMQDYVTASDPMDGDLTDKIKAALSGDKGGSLSTVGTHQVELRVTNSMGDTARLTVPVEVYESTQYNATVNLTKGLVYLEKGSSFRAGAYLESLYAGYQTVSPTQLIAAGADISIQSDVQSNVPGTYSVTYTVTYGSYTGFTRLIVVVED